MKIEISTKELNGMLKDVSKCIESKPAVLWMKGVLLEAANGKLNGVATNGNQSIHKVVDCDVKEAGSIVLEDGKLFADVVSKLSGDCKIETSADGKKANIKAKGSKTSMLLQEEGTFVKPEHFEPTIEMNVRGDELCRALKGVQYAIAKNDNRVALTGANVTFENGTAKVVGLDGYRLAVYRIHCLDVGDEVNTCMLIPGHTVSSILGIFGDAESVNIVSDGKKIGLSTDEVQVQAQLLAGEYPDYKRIMPKQSTTKVQVSTRELREAISRALLMCGNSTLLKFRIEQEQITITSNSEIGNSEENVECMTEGNPMEIAFNGRFLLESLGCADSENVMMKMTTEVSPAILMAADGGDWLHVVLPVRVVGAAN